MQTIQFKDGDTQRAQRNLTRSQKRNNTKIKEGVIINNYKMDSEISDSPLTLKDSYDALIISHNAKLPKQLKENSITQTKSILPLSAVAIGVMGTIAGFTMFAKRNAKISNEIAKEKWITSFTRNISINEETLQAIVQMVQSPNSKTIRAALGVLTLTASAFMCKTFFDGFKEVWVKKREAEIQKNLQEKLISIETDSFGGKIKIIRNMLAEKSKLFSKYLNEPEATKQNFGMFKFNDNLSFGTSDASPGAQKTNHKRNIDFLKSLAIGIGTTISILGLTLFSLKNIRSGKIETDKYIKKTIKDLKLIASSGKDKELVENYLDKMLQSIDANETLVKDIVNHTNWSALEKEEFTNKVLQNINTSTVKVNPNIGGDGTAKPSFSSFVNDYRAFFFNLLIEPNNKQFQQLFYGATALAGTGYIGKLMGEAIKEVQVKKFNAETELDLQQKLISTELRNFQSKKEAAIQPLVKEFFNQVDKGKDKQELKTIAENILLEIKNGPPFVYS